MSADPVAPSVSLSSGAPEEFVRELERQGIAPGSYRYTPVPGLRKVIARRMTESVETAPHCAVTMKVEIDRLEVARQRLNDQARVRISLNDLVIKASAAALIKVPQVNATYSPHGIALHNHADVAFAVAMDGGLVTPIIRAAETKSIFEIAAETRELAARGRNKRLRPEEYAGGSFSVSNLGMYGVTQFGAIINQPQVGILSVGAGEKCHLFDDDVPRIGTVMTATLTTDHRLIDGAVAAAWLQQFKFAIETPDLLCS